jgi:hypothetical protein
MTDSTPSTSSLRQVIELAFTDFKSESTVIVLTATDWTKIPTSQVALKTNLNHQSIESTSMMSIVPSLSYKQAFIRFMQETDMFF